MIITIQPPVSGRPLSAHVQKGVRAYLVDLSNWDGVPSAERVARVAGHGAGEGAPGIVRGIRQALGVYGSGKGDTAILCDRCGRVVTSPLTGCAVCPSETVEQEDDLGPV